MSQHILRSPPATALCVSLLATACGSEPPPPELGFLSISATPAVIDSLKSGLRQQGLIEDSTVRITWRIAEHRDSLGAIAQDFVTRGVKLIIAGGTEAARAAKQKTTMIPIVMTNSGDPVSAGLVTSLARPGGNITGLTQISPTLTAKRVELLKEAVPNLDRIGVLWNPDHATASQMFAEIEAAAPQLGVRIVSLAVRRRGEMEEAFRSASDARVGAMLVLRDPLTVQHREQIAELAGGRRLPAMYESRDFVDAGGLMYYGPSLEDLYKRSATYVRRVLDGVDPAELPVEQPATFDLVISVRAAKAMRLVLPEPFMLRATEVVR